LKAFDKLYQFHGNSAFSTWLIRIGINEALLRLKDIKRGKVIYLAADDVGTEALNRIPDKQINAERVIIRQESQQLLERAIDSLPEKYRVIYMMKEVEGLSNGEIAECLGLTESNVKVRGYRAKAILKDTLLEMSQGGSVFEFGNARCAVGVPQGPGSKRNNYRGVTSSLTQAVVLSSTPGISPVNYSMRAHEQLYRS
jgi:RNA polymerase sigma-70 factor (ECF subfamily)